MENRFRCTGCGKCCYGQVWLNLSDAFMHAERFPLAFVWTPVQQENKDFAMASSVGTTIQLTAKRSLAVVITAASYLPPSYACPALREDNLCGIHETKPARCRTMPFSPYRDERHQGEILAQLKGWDCDTSETAPVVFREKAVVLREDFDRERQAILGDVPVIRRYADYVVKYMPTIVDSLAKAALKPKAGQVITSLSSFLTATRNADAKQIAEKQYSVLDAYANKTANQKGLEDFHQRYAAWAKEMAFLSSRGATTFKATSN